MADDNKGSWAGEARGLIRLFNRFGRSLYGLLLLQIGWVVLVSHLKGLFDGAQDSSVSATSIFFTGALA
ncbi:MAG TPA: hypothetical protein VIL69_06495, partial [Roseomonas sp.]